MLENVKIHLLHFLEQIQTVTITPKNQIYPNILQVNVSQIVSKILIQ